MAITHDLITSQSLSGVSTITLNSFSGYTDLRFIFVGASVGANSNYNMRFNGDSNAVYGNTQLWGPDSTNAYTQRESGSTSINLQNSENSTISAIIVDIYNYANSTVKKGQTARIIEQLNLRPYYETLSYNQTSAITSITFFSSGSYNFNSASRVYLYGIKGA
jgi:hypothetical protein